jgi:hypothetical protein
MVRQPANIGGILATAVVVLLLCAIVVVEFPELLTLTDNPTNDFTVVRTKSASSPVLLAARKHLPASDVNSNTLAPGLLFSHELSLENGAHVPAGAFVLHSILRT